ncbi:MAG: hypothetical protein OXM55_06425 [Bdellovibrionales bacterium]|nr:hypothetical protein [Bdellovibrionales bacterium]
MYKIFFILIFVFGVNARADTSTSVFLNCDQLNALQYLGGCCKYSNEQRAYISNKKRSINPFSGERKYSRWQRKHIRGWYPSGVRTLDFFLYVKKEDVPWFNPNIQLKVEKCYNADWKEINYYGIPFWPFPTGKAKMSTKVPCDQAYTDPPITCQQAADSLPSEVFNP